MWVLRDMLYSTKSQHFAWVVYIIVSSLTKWLLGPDEMALQAVSGPPAVVWRPLSHGIAVQAKLSSERGVHFQSPACDKLVVQVSLSNLPDSKHSANPLSPSYIRSWWNVETLFVDGCWRRLLGIFEWWYRSVLKISRNCASSRVRHPLVLFTQKRLQKWGCHYRRSCRQIWVREILHWMHSLI